MNIFITLHQCTFNLLFALFSILIYQLSLHAINRAYLRRDAFLSQLIRPTQYLYVYD